MSKNNQFSEITKTINAKRFALCAMLIVNCSLLIEL